LSVPDEGYSRLSNLSILSVPDEGYSRLSNLSILSVPDAGYSRNKLWTLTCKVAILNQHFFRDPKDLVRPRIPLISCMECFAANETIEDFYSSAVKGKSVASKYVIFN
jgi:hypothetical protein